MHKIIAYRPSVYTISITGGYCELMCNHCKGKYLKNMKWIKDSKDLLDELIIAKEKGYNYILISGGFDKKGRLPIFKFLDVIKEGKIRTGIFIELHSGLIKEFDKLNGIIDAVLIDVIGSQETIDNYIKGDWLKEDYEYCMKLAKQYIPIVAAHVLIGVDNGKIKGEYEAIDMAIRANVDVLSILTLIDNFSDIDGIKDIMMYARENFKGHLTLGCMRLKGKYRPIIEKIAVDLQYDGIANPLYETLKYAKNVKIINGCCILK
ncbi:MAG: hypothetical protein NO483_03150 [Candidatus Methanomethylicia archaeon]|nr:hypothetical protein [Candidatus Methanomethylicia archaeon]